MSAASVILLGFLLSSYAMLHDCIIFLPAAAILTAAINERRWPVSIMFLFFMFTSYIGHPAPFFMRVTLLLLCVLALLLLVKKPLSAVPDRPGE